MRPLYLACHTGKVDVVSYLLELGADPLVARTSEATCLHVCAEKNFKEICRLLIANGKKALLYYQDGEGNTPLHIAADFDRPEIAEIIVTAAEQFELEHL